MTQFHNKVVFITGASAGIGAALAREFAHQGADLVLTARRVDRLDTLAQEIQKLGRKALPLACDVTQDGDLETAVQTALKEFGKIDIVIANAGFGVAGKLKKLTLGDYRRQFETNVFGVLRTIYASLNALKQSQGTLVLLGSVAGYVALPGSSPYGMSKFAIHALAGAITPELKADGISVVLIAPGFVESEIRQVDNLGKLQAHTPDPIHERLRMPTDKAAKHIIQAIAQKRPEQIITFHGKVVVFIRRHFPWIISFLSFRGLKGRGEPKR